MNVNHFLNDITVMVPKDFGPSSHFPNQTMRVLSSCFDKERSVLKDVSDSGNTTAFLLTYCIQM